MNLPNLFRGEVVSLTAADAISAGCELDVRVPQGDAAPKLAVVDLASRKLSVLQRTGLFGQNLKGCTIERACSADDLRQAYRLVHDVFVGSGFIDADPSGTRLRIYETTPETATFVAKVAGRVVAVLSVVEDSADFGLPADCVFKVELDALRRAGRRLCEVTNQAVADDYRKSAVPTELMRCAIAISLSEGYDEAIAAVSPSHNGFYDLLGFRQIGSQRSYSQTIDDPVIAVSMDIDQCRTPRSGLSVTAQFIQQFMIESNHFIARMSEWAQEAKRQFLDADLLKKLFLGEKNILARCSAFQLAVLQRRWGQATFAEVTAGMFVPGAAVPTPARAFCRPPVALKRRRRKVALRSHSLRPFRAPACRPGRLETSTSPRSYARNAVP